MSKSVKWKLLAAVAAVTPGVSNQVLVAQTPSAVQYSTPGVPYIQNFNTLPFVLTNATNAFNGGTFTVFRPNLVGTAGPTYDLGAVAGTPANAGTNVAGSNILTEAFDAAASNQAFVATTNAFTATPPAIVVSTNTPTTAVLTATQASDAANRAAAALRGWQVGQYTPAASTTTNPIANDTAFRFAVDAGGPSNTGSVRSFGLSAQNLLNNGVFRGSVGTVAANGGSVATVSSSLVGQTFDPTDADYANPSARYPFLDRALGTVASGSGRLFTAFTVQNTSDQTWTSITVGANFEVWRRGTTTQSNEGFLASYLVLNSLTNPATGGSPLVALTDADTTDTTQVGLTLYSTDVNANTIWSAAPTLDLIGPSSALSSTGTQNVPLNGSLTANQRFNTGSVPVTVNPGQYLILRYVDLDSQGTDNGNAIDDFTFTATGVTVPVGSRNLTYTGAVSSSFAAGGDQNFVVSGTSDASSLTVADRVSLGNAGLANASIVVPAGGTSVAALTVQNDSGTYNLSGGPINSLTGLIKSGNGTLVLSNSSNEFGNVGVRSTGGTIRYSTAAQLSATVSGRFVQLSNGAILESTTTSPIDLSSATVTVTGSVGGVISNAGPVTVGAVAGSGLFVKNGAGNLTANAYSNNGGLRVAAGTLTLNLPAGSSVSVGSTNDSTLTGNLVFTNQVRFNLNNLLSSNNGFGGVLGGGGTLFFDASGSTIATDDNNNAPFLTDIQANIVANRNNLPNFVLNIFPGFAGGTSSLFISRPITFGNPANPGFASAINSLNFAPGEANGNGSVRILTSLSYNGATTINTIGSSAGQGGPVVIGVTNALPITTTVAFNTSTAFNQGSSGSGQLSLAYTNNANVGVGSSQEIAGLISGFGNSPLTNLPIAQGAVGATATGIDPITTQLTINTRAGTSYTFNGTLIDSFSLIKVGPGTQRLGALVTTNSATPLTQAIAQTRTYTGTTEIREGTIEIFGGNNRLSPNSPLVLGNQAAGTTGRLVISGFNHTASALTTSGTSPNNTIIANVGALNVGTNVNSAGLVTNAGTTQVTTAQLTILSQDFNNSGRFGNEAYRAFNTTTFAGTITDGTARLSLVKSAPTTGTGTNAVIGNVGELRLAGSLAYSGDTTVNGGRLVVLTPLRPLAINPTTPQGSLIATGTNARLTIGVSSTGTGAVVAAQVNTFAATGGAIVQVQNPRFSVAGTVTNVAGPSVIVANTVSIDATSSVDLGTSDLIVQAGTVSAIRDLVSAWFTGGTRAGTTGLLTTASGPGVPAANLTTLAVFSNDAGNGLPYFNSYDGVSLTTSSIIVKYTYLGDTNLDGVVNGSDLANLIEGLSTPGASSYAQGDINYDGAVTLSDLALFNSVYSQVAAASQAAPLGGGSALGGLYGAVPEPSGLLAVLPAAAMLGRRRRRA